jgi:hypothetical protein
MAYFGIKWLSKRNKWAVVKDRQWLSLLDFSTMKFFKLFQSINNQELVSDSYLSVEETDEAYEIHTLEFVTKTYSKIRSITVPKGSLL